VTSRYAEIAPLLYRHTTFSFYDFRSFFAFSASIPPNRFHNIRKIHINLPAFQSFGPNYSDDSCSELVPNMKTILKFPIVWSYSMLDFTPIRHSHIHIQNLLPDFERDEFTNNWDAACRILGTMKELKRVEVMIIETNDLFQLFGNESKIFRHLQNSLEERVKFEGSIEWVPREPSRCSDDGARTIRGTWVDGEMKWRTTEDDRVIGGVRLIDDGWDWMDEDTVYPG
jgi:hypothetical protein